MSRVGRWSIALAAGTLAGLSPAAAVAEVVIITPAGFHTKGRVETPLAPAVLWRELVRPAGWWNPQHTYTGKAANLSLDPRPGGCFCETLPAGQGPSKAPGGGIEHMRVLYAEPGRILRMGGALGPLQGEALVGTLTITLMPSGKGTGIALDYVVGGFMRHKPEQIAPLVDAVLSEQLARLAAAR